MKQQAVDFFSDDKTGVATIIIGFFVGLFNWFSLGKFGVLCTAVLSLTMAYCHWDRNRRERIMFEQQLERSNKEKLLMND